jgi:hypothetical protein
MAEGTDLALEIKEALEIDPTNIVEEVRRQPSKYFYYGVLWARAAKQQRKLHLRVKAIEAELMKAARTENPKISAEMKNEYLNGNSDYQAAQQDEIQAQYMEEVLSVAKDGMRQRGMLLQELSRQNRSEEMYGDEFKAIKKEYEERMEDIPKKKKRIREEEDK